MERAEFRLLHQRLGAIAKVSIVSQDVLLSETGQTIVQTLEIAMWRINYRAKEATE